MILEHLRKLLEEIKSDGSDGDLPREIHVNPDQYPDVRAMGIAQGQGSQKFFIMTVHSVPFYADPELKKDEVKIVTATAGEKIITLKKEE